MSITTGDLKEPEGELDLALLFPDKTATQAEDDLQTWIDQGYALAAQANVVDLDSLDRGAKAYTYYRAYKSIYQRLSATASSVNVQDAGISSSMTQAQINSFQQKYVEWERIWVQVLSSVISVDVIPPATVPVPTQVGW